MYLQHFGLAEVPFSITPHPAFFYAGSRRGALLDALRYAVEQGEGIVKITGEVGTGKTMLCRMLIDSLPATIETVYIANPSLSPRELLGAVAAELGISHEDNFELARRLQDALLAHCGAGRQVVVLIDEAHAMPRDSLEEIRLLSNLETSRHKLLQIVLFGQPELDDALDRRDLRQLRERITHAFDLGPLAARDIGDYLNYRLVRAGHRGGELFRPDAVRLIAKASRGLTRRVNILADKSLLAAFADGSMIVTRRHARRALRDAAFAQHRSMWQRLSRRWRQTSAFSS